MLKAPHQLNFLKFTLSMNFLKHQLLNGPHHQLEAVLISVFQVSERHENVAFIIIRVKFVHFILAIHALHLIDKEYLR